MWCPACEIRLKNNECNNVRIGIKRNQENLHRRMISATSKKLKHAEIGDSVLIPISRPDMISSIGPSNLSGCITNKEDHLYTIGQLKEYLELNTRGVNLMYVTRIY